MHTASPTEDFRRCVADTAAPERRGSRRLWIGLAALVAVLALGALFPNAVHALPPGADTPL